MSGPAISRCAALAAALLGLLLAAPASSHEDLTVVNWAERLPGLTCSPWCAPSRNATASP